MRIRVDKAKACFIVVEPELTENIDSKDLGKLSKSTSIDTVPHLVFFFIDNALYCLCFRNVRKRLPIFVQTRFPETNVSL